MSAAVLAQSPLQCGIAPLAQRPARINREVRSIDFTDSSQLYYDRKRHPAHRYFTIQEFGA